MKGKKRILFDWNSFYTGFTLIENIIYNLLEKIIQQQKRQINLLAWIMNTFQRDPKFIIKFLHRGTPI